MNKEKIENGAVRADGNKTRRFNVLPKIICLFFAVVIWYYVMQVDNPDYKQTISGIKVNLVNTDELTNRGLSIFNGTSYTADITVSGKKSVINNYTSEDISIKADILKNYTTAGMQVVDLDVTLPSGLSLVSQDNSISVFVDEKTSVKLPVTVDQRTGATTSAEYESGALVPEFSEVTVKGPKTIVDTIDSAKVKADFSEFGILESTITTNGAVTLYNKNGEEISSAYVTLDYPTMKVTYPIYLTKDVPVSVDFKYGYFNESNVDISINPASVLIRGDAADVKKVSEVVCGVIDEKQVDRDKTITFGLVPEEGYDFVDDVTAAQVTISNVGTVTKIYRVENLAVTGGDRNCEVADEYVDVTLRGPAAELSDITAEDISVISDISDYDSSLTGELSFDAEVTLSGDHPGVWEIGNYKLTVRVSNNG